MAIDLEEQYDKIYRYCYFKLHNRELAEDITQETFLKYLERYHFSSSETTLKCLYTIARNLCIDEYRKPAILALEDDVEKHSEPPCEEDTLLTTLAVRDALKELTAEEQELLLLRYANEVPVGVIAKLFGISRFALRRRLLAALKKMEEKLREEDFS